jgi:hypothetical protein
LQLHHSNYVCNQVGSLPLRRSFIISIFITVFVTLILIINEYRPRSDNTNPTQRFATAIYSIAGLLMIYEFLSELPAVLFHGIYYWTELRGAAFFDAILKTLTLASFTGLCILRAIESRDTSTANDDFHVANHFDQANKYCLIVCVLATWFNLYYYFMAFDFSGPFVLTLFKIVNLPAYYRLCFILLSFVGHK